MNDRRLLALSYYFPPMTEPEALLIAKRLVNLSGWIADVVAASPFHPAMGDDRDLAAYVAQVVKSVARVAPSVRVPWHRLGSLGRIPDGFRWLNPKVIRAATLLGLDRYHAMLSWSQSHAIHLAALKLKSRNPSLPWLAHFSDPWADNPFLPGTGIAAAINRRLEHSVIAHADRVVFTTPETAELVMAKYPVSWREKVRVVPHGFEPALYSNERPPILKGRPRVLRYLGNFYGPRSPDPLFRALGKALCERPSLATGLKVEIIGRLDYGMADTEAARALPAAMVSVKPAVGYRESLRLMETADVLLLVDAPARLSVFLPSKLVDYLGTGRPIIAFTPPGASARVLAEVGWPVADPADVEACCRVLFDVLDRSDNLPAPASVPPSYSAQATSEAFAEILNELAPRVPSIQSARVAAAIG